MAELNGTERTRLTRLPERGVTDRAVLHQILDEALVCHVAVVEDGYAVAFPTTYGWDPDGPDEHGTLYLHGSVAAPWLRSAAGQTVSVTFTLLDGIVAARSAFHHSMNYRSAVVIGQPRVVTGEDERNRAMAGLVDHIVPGRAQTLRPNTRKELAATTILALSLAEASVKRRAGGPGDDQADIDAGIWAGVIPLRLTAGPVEADADGPDHMGPVPDDVRRRADSLRP